MKQVLFITTIIMIVSLVSACDDDTGSTNLSFGGNYNQITAFGINTTVGTIDQEAQTITVNLGEYADLTELVAVFSSNGVSVKVGETEQLSGVSQNDFSSPVTYTVTAEDGSNREYVAAVHQPTSFEIGDKGPSGGYIFYVNPDAETDGWSYLEAAPYNESIDGNYTFQFMMYEHGSQDISGLNDESLGGGKINTDFLVANIGSGPFSGKTMADFPAFKVCLETTQGGYDDWYLPNVTELEEMFTEIQQTNINTYLHRYWSSKISWGGSYYNCCWFDMIDGSTDNEYYTEKYFVRPVRRF